MKMVTFLQATQTDDKTDTGQKKYITMTVPCVKTVITLLLHITGGANLPLRVVVTIPAIGPSDPSDTTDDSARNISCNYDYTDYGHGRSPEGGFYPAFASG